MTRPRLLLKNSPDFEGKQEAQGAQRQPTRVAGQMRRLTHRRGGDRNGILRDWATPCPLWLGPAGQHQSNRPRKP
ncbi:MAG: hypothetical protein ACREV4_10245 [Gammaproteobacteria bacterium]